MGAVAAATTTPPQESDARLIRQVEDDILAAAELAVPLTADQQERVRLDTIVRKGELDGTHAMLFRLLRLPPEQLDALKTLLVERNQAIHDAGQVATEEGLVFATFAEVDEVNRMAVAAIDRRIATTLGAGTLAALQDYESLTVFRGLSGLAATTGGANYPVDDEAVLSLARALRNAAPEYLELTFQANGWPIDPPTAMRDVIVQTLGPDAGEAFARRFEVRPIDYELAAYVRDAVLAGKLPPSSLRGNIAREYEAALAAQRPGAKP